MSTVTFIRIPLKGVPSDRLLSYMLIVSLTVAEPSHSILGMLAI